MTICTECLPPLPKMGLHKLLKRTIIASDYYKKKTFLKTLYLMSLKKKIV